MFTKSDPISKQKYRVKRIERETPDGKIWDNLPPLYIDNFPWDKNGYRPVTKVGLFYTPIGLHIRFKTYEDNPRITYEKMNDPVYRDSCVEFFFKPVPESDKRYLNFETNAAGTLLLGLGEDRPTRSYLQGINPQIFHILTGNGAEPEPDGTKFWTLEYTIPFDFIKAYFKDFQPVAGKQMEANFYKCGDDTAMPHYGCWNMIQVTPPDFHRPEFFGVLILE